MLYFIYDIPLGVLAILFCVACMAFTWGGLFLLRPRVRRWVGPEPGMNDMVSTFLSAYGVFYGLMLGLIAVATYQNFDDVEGTVDREAAALAALYRDVSSYPDPVRGQLQQHVREYVRFTIEEAWPAQQRGEAHPGGTARVTALHDTMVAFDPRSRREEILHGEALRQFNVFMEARYARLQAVGTSLSGVLWWVVAIGAALNLALLWLFSVERLSVHVALSGVLSAFVGLMLFFIAAMDNPFRGEESVTPAPFELIRDRLMATARA